MAGAVPGLAMWRPARRASGRRPALRRAGPLRTGSDPRHASFVPPPTLTSVPCSRNVSQLFLYTFSISHKMAVKFFTSLLFLWIASRCVNKHYIHGSLFKLYYCWLWPAIKFNLCTYFICGNIMLVSPGPIANVNTWNASMVQYLLPTQFLLALWI